MVHPGTPVCCYTERKREAPTMLENLFNALCQAFGQFILAVVIAPMGVILAGYLVYILVMTIREFRRKSLSHRFSARTGPGEPRPLRARRAAALPGIPLCGRRGDGGPGSSGADIGSLALRGTRGRKKETPSGRLFFAFLGLSGGETRQARGRPVTFPPAARCCQSRRGGAPSGQRSWPRLSHSGR